MAQRDAFNDYVDGISSSKKQYQSRSAVYWIMLWFATATLFVAFHFFIGCSWFWSITLLLACMVLFLPAILFGLAPLDIFFSFIQEGTAIVIVAGGGVVDILIQYKDHILGLDGKVVKQPGAPQISFLGIRGLYFNWRWPVYRVYKYVFSWITIDKEGEKRVHEKETLRHILLQDALYWFNVPDAKDKTLLPLDIEGFVIVQVIDPYATLFIAQNWLKILIGELQTLFRNEAREATYEDLTSGDKMIGTKLKKDEQVKGKIDELESSYGIRIVGVEIKKINPPKDLLAVTLKKLIAEREREATVVAADAEAQRVQKVCTAISEQGDIGRLNRILEALEKGGDNKWIVPTDLVEAAKTFAASRNS